MPLRAGLQRRTRHLGASLPVGAAPPVRRQTAPPFGSYHADRLTQAERSLQTAEAWRGFTTSNSRLFVADVTTGRSSNANSMVASAMRGKRAREDGNTGLITSNRYDGSHNAAPPWSLAQPLYGTDPLARQRLQNSMQVEDVARREAVEHVAKRKAVGTRMQNPSQQAGREADPSESRPFVRTCDLGVSATPMRAEPTLPPRSVIPVIQDPTALTSTGRHPRSLDPKRQTESYTLVADPSSGNDVNLPRPAAAQRIVRGRTNYGAVPNVEGIPGPTTGRQLTVGSRPTQNIGIGLQTLSEGPAPLHTRPTVPSGVSSHRWIPRAEAADDTLSDWSKQRRATLSNPNSQVRPPARLTVQEPVAYPPTAGGRAWTLQTEKLGTGRGRLATMFDLEHWMEVHAREDTAPHGVTVKQPRPRPDASHAQDLALLTSRAGGPPAAHPATKAHRLADTAWEGAPLTGVGLPRASPLPRPPIRSPDAVAAEESQLTRGERDMVWTQRRDLPHNVQGAVADPGAARLLPPTVVRASEGRRLPARPIATNTAKATPLELPLARNGGWGIGTHLTAPVGVATTADSRTLVDQRGERPNGMTATQNRVTDRERETLSSTRGTPIPADPRNPWIFTPRG